MRLYRLAGKHRELVELYERAVDEAPTVERKVTYLFKIGRCGRTSSMTVCRRRTRTAAS